MARMARVVVPGLPHHVTQRGGRRQQTFFDARDYDSYLTLLRGALDTSGVAIWAYCLMPNHVHVIAVPDRADALARLFGRVHRRYAQCINEREGWQGHLWQQRFHSVVMDERHLLLAARYIEQNPVRAGLCRHPEDWPWSSVHAHLGRRKDPHVDPKPLRDCVPDWASFVAVESTDQDCALMRRGTRRGRPLGDEAFVAGVEQATGRSLRPRPPGRPPRPTAHVPQDPTVPF